MKKTGNASAAQRGAAVAFALACSGVNMFSLQYHTVAVSATTHIPLYVNSDAYRRHRSSYYNGELISGEGDGYLVVLFCFRPESVTVWHIFLSLCVGFVQLSASLMPLITSLRSMQSDLQQLLSY